MPDGKEQDNVSEMIPPRFKHQQEGLDLAGKYLRYGFWYEPGCGKTRIGLDINERRPRKTLVLCPINLIENAWIEDAEKFTPSLRIKSLRASTKAKRVKLIHANDWDYGVLNFESFRPLVDEFRKVGIQRIIVDESSKLKDAKSKTSKSVYEAAWLPTVEEVYLLSGTPAPNSKEEYYGQLRCLIQPGSVTSFPKSYWAFRNRYFYCANQYTHTWKERQDTAEALEHLISSVSVYKSLEECIPDMPEQRYVKRFVGMTKEQKALYDQLKEEWIIEHKGETTVASTALVEVMKLRQITAGFTIPLSGAATHISDAKIEELLAISEELGDRQAIIWFQFTDERKRIVEALGEENCAQMHKDVPKGEARSQQAQDFRSGKKRFMVAHPLSMAHGFTFVNAAYQIWMSQSYSYEECFQGNRRNFRAGQTENCTYYYVMCKGTIDEIIYSAVKAKQSVAQALLEKLR